MINNEYYILLYWYIYVILLIQCYFSYNQICLRCIFEMPIIWVTLSNPCRFIGVRAKILMIALI